MITRNRLITLCLIFTFLFFSNLDMLSATERTAIPETDFSIYLPDGWESLNSSKGMYSFTDSEHKAVFQVYVFSSKDPNSIIEIYNAYMSRLGAQEEHAEFSYNGESALFGDFNFKPSAWKARGYTIALYTEKGIVILSAYAPLQFYNNYHDKLLSCIDSFSPASNKIMKPGPISHFYYNTGKKNPRPRSIFIPPLTLTAEMDPAEAEASQVFIEREARVLTEFEENWKTAWIRYYRLVFRDSFVRFTETAEKFQSAISDKTIERKNVPIILLKWLQTFSYKRKNSTSDLHAPIEALFTKTADCDGRALIFCILLEHLGFDTLLLVSKDYSHSIAAVNAPLKGDKKVKFEGNTYILAEFTEDVPIGSIQDKISDMSKWIPVSFPKSSHADF